MSNGKERGLNYGRSLLKKKKDVWRLKRFISLTIASHLEFSTVTLLSLLHVAVATLLSAVEHLDLRHVEQTHPHSFLKAGSQVFLAAAAEHRWERVPVSDSNIFLRRGRWEMTKDPPAGNQFNQK